MFIKFVKKEKLSAEDKILAVKCDIDVDTAQGSQEIVKNEILFFFGSNFLVF